MLENCIAVTAGKGGVLKTSISSHLSGLAASAGWRVLLVDADPQGNAMFDLGFSSDGGQAFAAALVGRRRLTPIKDVRPGLDVVAGGPALDDLATRFTRPAQWNELSNKLAPLASNYDLIIIDSPARELWLRRMILSAARFLIIPSGIDRASRVGLPDAAATVHEVRAATNPELDVLAVVTGPMNATSTRLRQRSKEHLGALIGDPDLVCDTIVRYAPLIAEQCRDRGLLTTEYADLVNQNHAHLPEDPDHAPHDRSAVSRSADRLANDWQRLVNELLVRFLAARTVDLRDTAGGSAEDSTGFRTAASQ